MENLPALIVFIIMIAAFLFFYYDIVIKDSFGMIKDRFIMPFEFS